MRPFPFSFKSTLALKAVTEKVITVILSYHENKVYTCRSINRVRVFFDTHSRENYNIQEILRHSLFVSEAMGRSRRELINKIKNKLKIKIKKRKGKRKKDFL